MGNGRRPKPTAMKELAGNPGHRPLNDAEPKPDKAAPEMPKGMLKAARREWAAIVPSLLRIGVLSNIDGKALAAYCDAYAHWELARKQIEKYGLVIEEPVLRGVMKWRSFCMFVPGEATLRDHRAEFFERFAIP